MSTPASPLQALPTELLLLTLTHLDLPDLLSLTRTSHHLRTLSHDPLLHQHRLLHASFTLSLYLPLRPPLTYLLEQRIYITRTTLAARTLGRDFIRIKLNRMLGRRPRKETLVERGVLPMECLGAMGGVAPGLVRVKRGLERERVKDKLRGWVGEWWRRGVELRDRRGEGEEVGRTDVRRMARWFGREGQRWDRGGYGGYGYGGYGGEGKKRREEPTRAKVLGLRRFWEKVGREGGAGLGH